MKYIIGIISAVVGLTAAAVTPVVDEATGNVTLHVESAETYAYMLAKMNNNTAGTWGEGMIRYPGENLWTVIRTVAEKLETENADYSAEIEVLQETLERQKGYRAEIEADFAESLSAMIELFNSAAE